MALYNLVRVYTYTTGTGPVVCGPAVVGYLDFTGISGVVSYGLASVDKNTGKVSASEVGRGTVTAGILTRDTVLKSTSGGAKINLENAQVFITALAEDFTDPKEYIDFVLNPTSTIQEGRLQWNPTDGTLDLGLPYGVTLQVGQEMPLPAFNDTGVAIAEGVPVYISGRQGHIPEITPARSDAEATSCIFGITTSTFGTTGDLRYGFVTVFGYVRKIKTDYTGSGDWGTSWAANDKLYVSKTIAGQLTNVEPAAPHHSDVVGTVAIVGSLGTGSILVINQKHMTLEELTDVDGTPLATDGQFPAWNNTAGYFDFNYNINNYIANALLTTQGDLIYRNATIPDRLPLAGVSGSLLTRDANDPAWSAFALGGGNAAAVYSFPAAASGGIPLLNLAQTFTAAQTITPASGVGLTIKAASRAIPFEAFGGGDANGGIFTTNYGASSPGITSQRANGTVGSPAFVAADQYIMFFGGRGYATGAGFGAGASAYVGILAAENFNSGSNRGTYIQFATTPTGSGSAAEAARLTAAGHFGLGITIPLARSHTVGAASGIAAIIQTGSTPGDALQIRDSLTAIHTFFTATGGLTGNEQGTATGDLRWESLTEANMLLLDANGDTDGALYFGGSTNGIKVNKGGELTLLGTATVWKDVDFPIIIRTTGTNIPTLETINGNLTMPQWQVNDFNMCESQEFIHEWKEGSTAYFHIHLTTNGLDATDRYVRFEIEYGYSTPGGVWVFPTTMDSGDLLIPASTADKTMLILSIGNFTPTGVEIGGHVLARLKRIAATGTAPTNNPWIPMLQMHLECDSMGSKTISDK